MISSIDLGQSRIAEDRVAASTKDDSKLTN